jgi:Flp pilus assembly pilin Flp
MCVRLFTPRQLPYLLKSLIRNRKQMWPFPVSELPFPRRGSLNTGTRIHLGEYFKMLKLFVKAHTLLQSLKEDESGQDLIEYALLLGLITVGAIASITALGASIATQWAAIAAAL